MISANEKEFFANLREVKVVSTVLLAILALIALVALAEKGPPIVAIYRGASPYNTGFIGTYKFVEILRKIYPQTFVIRSYQELDRVFSDAGKCLFVVVSPEIDYTMDEAKEIAEKLRKCRFPAVLIADENKTSNNLLEALGSSIRISGNLLYNRFTGLPYIYAIIRLPTNSSYMVLLDKASEILAPTPTIIGISVNGEAVMALENVDDFLVVVLADGSIFLNQVLDSDVASYKEMIIELVKYMCSDDCRIAVDGTKYEPIEVEAVQKNMNVSVYIDPLMLTTLSTLKLFHPYTWLPWILLQINNFVGFIKGLPYIAPFFVAIIAYLIYRYVVGKISIFPDARIGEQKEVEIYLTEELRDSVIRGRISLDKQDFISLFELVDSAVRLTYGVGLCDPDAHKVLQLGRDADRYARDMCRLYAKASGRKRLPIVLSWNRTTKKMIKRSEEFLKTMGYSLAKEKGVEYLLLR
ncbi:MAG: hypothetical protein QXF79_02960 [Ignisphaera sp.]